MEQTETTAWAESHRATRRDFLRIAGALGVVGAAGGIMMPLTGSRARGGHRVLAAQSTDFSDPRVRMQHLLRRTGFSPTEEELGRALDMGEAEVIEQVTSAPKLSGVPARLASTVSGDGESEEALVAWWFNRMLHTAAPQEEKLTLFWHGWHVTSFDKVDEARLMYRQLLFQRRHAVAPFAETLKGVSREPAMLKYLDNDPNQVGQPNENWARELMELFSMGVGNYTEADVREAARAFTGYSYDYESGDFLFELEAHDKGAKTVLGRRGNLSGDDVIDTIVAHEATAPYVARRVWTRFAYPGPEDETLEPLVAAFRSTGGEMQAVFRAAFSHPQFFIPRAHRALVKSPVEYLVGAVRQLGLKVKADDVAYRCEQMGQRPGSPPNVAGWPGGRAWLGTGPFLARVNAMDDLLFGGIEGTEFDTRSFVSRRNLETAGELIDYLANLALDGLLEREARETLVAFASGGRGASQRFDSFTDDERDLRIRGTVYLVFASPEYQLA